MVLPPLGQSKQTTSKSTVTSSNSRILPPLVTKRPTQQQVQQKKYENFKPMTFQQAYPGVDKKTSITPIAKVQQKVVDFAKNPYPEVKMGFAENIDKKYHPIGYTIYKGVQEIGNMLANTPREATKASTSLGSHIGTGTSNPKQVAGDLATAVQFPLLFLGIGEAGGKIAVGEVAKTTIGKTVLKTAAKGLAKATAEGTGWGILGGLQSGKDIKDDKQYLTNLLQNVGLGAATGLGLGTIAHVAVPLAKGLTSKMGSIFVKVTDKTPKIERIQLDPKVAQSTVINSKLEKEPLGKKILKESVAAQQTESHVAIIPSTEGKYTLPNGQKVDIEVAPAYNPSSNSNPVPSSVITQPEGHTMTHVNDLVSLKEEPPISIENAKRYISDAAEGKGQPREPLKTIKMQSGKHLIVDGNATYNAVKDAGHTHIPTTAEDISKWGDFKPTDQHLTDAAKEHFMAHKNKKTYGKLFTEIADKFGLKKIGHPEKSDVKSIVGIIEKRHLRNVDIKDVLRDTIIINKPEDAAKVVEELRSRGFSGHMFDSERRSRGFKNRFEDQTPGYKDANYQFTGPDGQVVELQMMQKHMYAEKKAIGHPVYDMVDKAGNVVKDLTPEQKNALEVWKKYADDRYHAAFLRDNPDLAKTSSDLTTSSVTGTPVRSPESISSLKEHLNTLRQAESTNLRSAADKVDSALTSDIHNSSTKSIAEDTAKINHTATEADTGIPKGMKESRHYKRLLEHFEATNPELYNQLKNDPKLLYKKVNQEYDYEGAAKLVETDPEKAYRIAKGYEPSPTDQRRFSVAAVLSDRAVKEGNSALMKDIEQTLSLSATRKGQELYALRGRFDQNSPQAFVQQVLDSRLSKLGKGYVTTGIDIAKEKSMSMKQKAVARIDKAVERAQQFTKKERTKIDFAQKLLDDLTCK